MNELILSIFVVLMPHFTQPVNFIDSESWTIGLSSYEEVNIYTKNQPVRKIARAIAHELCHAHDLKHTPASTDSDFTDGWYHIQYDNPSVEYYELSWENNKQSWNNNFCTEYGSTDPFEDYAECCVMYMYAGRTMRESPELRQKYDFIKGRFKYEFDTVGNKGVYSSFQI